MEIFHSAMSCWVYQRVVGKRMGEPMEGSVLKHFGGEIRGEMPTRSTPKNILIKPDYELKIISDSPVVTNRYYVSCLGGCRCVCFYSLTVPLLFPTHNRFGCMESQVPAAPRYPDAPGAGLRLRCNGMARSLY